MEWPRPGHDPYAAARAAMVESLRPHVRDERVLDAFGRVPRERFVAPELRHRAYDDTPLPIGHGQTISQPLVVAIMLDLLRLQPEDRALDIGTGSGYQAALMSLLVREVVTVERIPELAESAAAVLEELGYANVVVHVAGEQLGWPEGAPYNAIACAAAAPRVPEALVEQLTPDGRLVLPVGPLGDQELVLVERTPQGTRETRKGGCRFVPLIGEGAYRMPERRS
ncbi:MAG TPA: protein-L-isoaspartate(D-aspartate) O-methyltransferase [Dehalococcoidia bacterium]|nr:protein-L-isoaspartate(D-aspartate) O-methyltransferase [Dehalococcoidia bacterium]